MDLYAMDSVRLWERCCSAERRRERGRNGEAEEEKAEEKIMCSRKENECGRAGRR